MAIEKLAFESEYFELYKIEKSCYAAIEKENEKAGSNAGFVDLGNCVIVFDTFLSPDAASDMKRAINQITGKSVEYVINSHDHADHWMGNGVFSAPIYSTKATKESIEGHPSIEKIKNLEESWFEEREKEIENENDEMRKKNLLNDTKFVTNIYKAKIVPPDKIVSQSFVTSGSEERASVELIGAAHSKGDIIMRIPDQKVIFMGDLLFSRCFTWMGSGDPDKYIKVMKQLLASDTDYYVPGHGPMAGKEEVELQIKYMEEIMHLARQYKKEGKDIKSIELNQFSKEFQDWDPMVNVWNLDFLSKYLENDA